MQQFHVMYVTYVCMYFSNLVSFGSVSLGVTTLLLLCRVILSTIIPEILLSTTNLTLLENFLIEAPLQGLAGKCTKIVLPTK